MKASDRVLSARYAAALFQAAEDKSEGRRVQSDLILARELLLELDAQLRHPLVAAAVKKENARARLAGKVCETTRRFVEVLLEKKRYELLPMIASDYARLEADKRGVVRALVRSARPLSGPAREDLARRLKAFAGKDVEIEVKEDQALIGGATVKIGDWILDSSLRGRLRRMRESIQ